MMTVVAIVGACLSNTVWVFVWSALGTWVLGKTMPKGGPEPWWGLPVWMGFGVGIMAPVGIGGILLIIYTAWSLAFTPA